MKLADTSNVCPDDTDVGDIENAVSHGIPVALNVGVGVGVSVGVDVAAGVCVGVDVAAGVCVTVGARALVVNASLAPRSVGS